MTIIDLNILIKWLEKNNFIDNFWTDFEGNDVYVDPHLCSMATVLDFLKNFKEYLYSHPEHRDQFIYRG